MCLAVPGRIEAIDAADPLVRRGRVSFAGVVRDVDLTLVPEAAVGDHVLAHVGVAISVIDEDAAARTLAALEQLREPDGETPG